MSFTWKKFYEEFAKKLLEYKNRRQELVETIYSVLGDTLNDSGTSVVNYFKKDKDTKLTDTDPFSVFAIFNRTSNDSVRKNCIEILKNTFEIQAEIPSDFDGIPLLDARKAIFVNQKSSNVEQNNTLLWNLFEKAIKNEDFEQEYNEALKIKGVNNNLSMGLFWICPDRFLGLDSNNRNYIEQKLRLKISDKPNYQEYKALLNEVRASHYDDFAELSLKAWKYSKNEETETMNNNNNYIEILKKNHNIVFTGAPGTGKTYLAKQIASKMVLDNYDFENLTDKEKKIFDERVGFVQFHPSYDYTDFVEGLRPITDSNGNVGFERRDGGFKEFCKRAIINKKESSFISQYNKLCDDIRNNNEYSIMLKSGKKSTPLSVTTNNTIKWKCQGTDNKDVNAVTCDRLIKLYSKYNSIEVIDNLTTIDSVIRNVIGGCNSTYYWAVLREVVRRIKQVKTNYIFIIDEINRGEISKIFGELFFSVDPGYRGEKGKVKTQYQNMIEDGDVFKNDFYVPDNVYIIGTMNDIDRSVESMDFAMRRRFTWIEIEAESRKDMLDSLGDYAEEAKARMAALNKEIEKTHELGKAYEIGPAYFLKLKDLDYSFENLWKMNLEPLLREYLRGYNNAKKIIEDCEKAYGLTKTDEK